MAVTTSFSGLIRPFSRPDGVLGPGLGLPAAQRQRPGPPHALRSQRGTAIRSRGPLRACRGSRSSRLMLAIAGGGGLVGSAAVPLLAPPAYSALREGWGLQLICCSGAQGALGGRPLSLRSVRPRRKREGQKRKPAEPGVAGGIGPRRARTDQSGLRPQPKRPEVSCQASEVRNFSGDCTVAPNL